MPDGDWPSISSNRPPTMLQVGGLGSITIGHCAHAGITGAALNSASTLVLQLAKLTFGLFQDGFQSLAFDQHGLALFPER